MVHAYLSSPYYWLGRIDEAIVRARQSLAAAREANHTSATVFALPNLGMALAAGGRYDEAQRAFDEARRFGNEYAVGTLQARGIAISAGYHLEVFDFVGNEALAEEARELARSLNFTPPIISAGLDLILNFARQHDVGRAERVISEVAAVAETATAWHGWLWGLRLAEARAEVALARGDWEEARAWATRAVEQSHARGRVKYEALGLITRGQAQAALGRSLDAVADLDRAVGLARQIGDPALFLRAAAALLPLNGHELLAVEARAKIDDIEAALSDAVLRETFVSAEPVTDLQHMLSHTPLHPV
jgi:tetratricopeptide (TPR) repeat protein